MLHSEHSVDIYYQEILAVEPCITGRISPADLDRASVDVVAVRVVTLYPTLSLVDGAMHFA